MVGYDLLPFLVFVIFCWVLFISIGSFLLLHPTVRSQCSGQASDIGRVLGSAPGTVLPGACGKIQPVLLYFTCQLKGFNHTVAKDYELLRFARLDVDIDATLLVAAWPG